MVLCKILAVAGFTVVAAAALASPYELTRIRRPCCKLLVNPVPLPPCNSVLNFFYHSWDDYNKTSVATAPFPNLALINASVNLTSFTAPSTSLPLTPFITGGIGSSNQTSNLRHFWPRIHRPSSLIPLLTASSMILVNCSPSEL